MPKTRPQPSDDALALDILTRQWLPNSEFLMRRIKYVLGYISRHGHFYDNTLPLSDRLGYAEKTFDEGRRILWNPASDVIAIKNATEDMMGHIQHLHETGNPGYSMAYLATYEGILRKSPHIHSEYI